MVRDDLLQCEAFDTVTVNPYICPELIITDEIKHACYNICNGSIKITDVVNAITPLTYLWNNGETTSELYDLCSSDYSVTITDASNCTVIKNYNINENPLLTANLVGTDESCEQCNDGSAIVDPSGGTEPYTYIWSNDDDNQEEDYGAYCGCYYGADPFASDGYA